MVAQGLEQEMQMSREQLENELNSGRFLRRIKRKDRRIVMRLGVTSVEKNESLTIDISMIMNDGSTKGFFLKADPVDDPTGDVKAILSVRCE